MRSLHAALSSDGGGGAKDLSARDRPRADPCTPERLVRVWAHEGMRLFHDRLVDRESREWTSRMLDDVALRRFPSVGAAATAKPMLMTRMVGVGALADVTTDEAGAFLRQRLAVFAQEELGVRLVLFPEAIEQVLRIGRVLQQPVGHVLLVGACGVGKTVLSRFAAWLLDMAAFQIKPSRGYTSARFHEDLRALLRRTGIKGERVVFLFDEANAVDASFLESMNALLASGEVPGLFDGEELASLIAQCRDVAAREGVTATSEGELWQLFVARVQRNLHVVFTVNSGGSDWQRKSVTSPALFNRCVVLWFPDWDGFTLTQVATELLAM